MRSYIVTWSFDYGGVGEPLDYWVVCESYTDARRAYTKAIDSNAYVATISQVIESTDYEPLNPVRGNA